MSVQVGQERRSCDVMGAKFEKKIRTDAVGHGVAGVASLKDKDSGVGVFGETCGYGKACSTTADDNKVV